MSMVVEYKGLLVVESELPSHIMEEWKTTLKNEQSRIYNALLTKIPDETAFKSKIAEASSEVYGDFVNPSYLRAKIIKLKQKIKLGRAYNSWKNGVVACYGEGGYFADRVESKASKFALARYPISVVGSKPDLGWLCGYKAIGVITGDKRVARYMGPNDTLNGTITNAFDAAVAPFIRAFALPVIVQGLVIAQYAHEEGMTSERDSVITDTNSILDKVEGLAASGYTVTLEIGYDDTADKLYAHSKVETTT